MSRNLPINEGTWNRARRIRKGFYNFKNVIFSKEPTSATFVDNVGKATRNVTPVKIGNVFVIGVRSDWYKMVAVDANGNYVENRYMSRGSTLNEANWNRANRLSR